MRTYTLSEAAEICGVSVKAIRRRAERGTIAVVIRDGTRRVPETELERVGLLPDAEIRSLRAEVARLEQELASHRLLVTRIERHATTEADARRRAEAAVVEARAAARQAHHQLHEIATLNWWQRRQRLHELRQSQ